jgi:hypothetical protein
VRVSPVPREKKFFLKCVLHNHQAGSYIQLFSGNLNCQTANPPFNNYYSPLELRWQQRLCQNKKQKSYLLLIYFLFFNSPISHHFSFPLQATFLKLYPWLHTSAGNFDVCSGQSNGRHSHVETDVIIEKKALIGRGPILHERLFLDAD